MPVIRAFSVLILFSVAFVLLPGCRQSGTAAPTGIRFVDVAKPAGINYVFSAGIREDKDALPLTILETIGNGCAFLDYDHDGNLDILLVGPKMALFKGDGKGHFRDVTHQTGLDKWHDHFLGCAVGDYDNDGYDDLYLSGYRTGRLLHNDSGKSFTDVSHAAGIHPERWGTSCGWADLDGDGRLDLVIANYVQFGPDPLQYPQRCEPLACPPQDYRSERPTCYRNLGGGRFADVSVSSGLHVTEGKGLGVAFADYDGDGRPDILIANDEVAGDLFHNDGGLHFTNVGRASGTAFGPEGRVQGGMGADWADYNGDGRLDAVVATYQGQPKSLYCNDGRGLFHNGSQAAGIFEVSKPFVAFGIKWLDYDNDGRPDLMIANGNVDNHIDVMFPDQHYRQRALVLHNADGTHLTDESAALGPDLQKLIVGRGLATGDFDNDGRIDALMVDANGPPLLLHNQGGHVGHWLGLALVGTGRSNRDALGARVTLTAGGRTQVKEVQTAGSYLSASDKRLLFGLGEATRIDSLSIRWPDGRTQSVTGLQVGRYQAIREAGGP